MKLLKIFPFFSNSDYDFRGFYTALDVAKYIVDKCSTDGRTISNLQLQKILYYVQKSSLQERKKAFFSDEIEAWPFGPVVREVYDYFCGFGAMPIFYLKIDGSVLSEEDSKFVNEIVEKKRLLRPWDMVKDTHQEGKAWDLIYRNGLGYKKIIPKRLIAENG